MADQRQGGISWTDQTWNPTRGCSRVSAGCKNCYAEGVAGRFSGPGQPYHGLAVIDDRGARWTGEMKFVEEHLLDPIRWKRPRRVFVNSMSDLFHEGLSVELHIARVFAVMALAPRHTFQVLTKRAARMQEIVSDVAFKNEVERICRELDGDPSLPKSTAVCTGYLRVGGGDPSMRWPLPNVWLGVSVEDQDAADERIPHLLKTPAHVRFLSCEPLLGPISLRGVLNLRNFERDYRKLVEQCGGEERMPAHLVWNGKHPGKIDWVIVGGESGPHARPMQAEWARLILKDCEVTGVSPWFKQTGSILARELGLHDRAGADPSEFPTWASGQQHFPNNESART